MPTYRNLSRPELVEWALRLEKDTCLTDTGALSVRSYAKTGRSPTDKRIVDTPDVRDDVNWGNVNIKLSVSSFNIIKSIAKNFIDGREHVFMIDAYAGHSLQDRLRVRIFTTRPYHALFIKNMLIEPSPTEMHTFVPDYTIYNAGQHQVAEWQTIPGLSSPTVVALNFESNEQVILGTEYAGEMKKGVLTVMMYLMARRGHLCMHASANEGKSDQDVTVFFGLSGTGKTTLSADPTRRLIGDDEHVWTEQGIFNVEGGCYAKAIGLSEKNEPDIYHAIRFGAVAENCGFYPGTRSIDYKDIQLTENTRVAYPLSFIEGAKIPAEAQVHPRNVVFLTNDAFGVMPPVSLLTPGQAKFWFVTGYTAKVPGTEQGVKDPTPTFSACFGGPFLVMHPTFYGIQLAEKLSKHKAHCWLVNTGWTGGGFGVGRRMAINVTRAIIRAINTGVLIKHEFTTMPGWGLRIPNSCPEVPSEVLNPYNAWKDKSSFVTQINKLASMFQKNFEQYKTTATPDMHDAVPKPYGGIAKP